MTFPLATLGYINCSSWKSCPNSENNSTKACHSDKLQSD